VTLVYKLGGPALEDPDLLTPLAAEIQSAREPVLLVHGGGRHVERALVERGIESRFIEGRRETSPAAIEVVEMVLSGVVNKALAAGLTARGVRALGLSGRDGGLLSAVRQEGLGCVGRPATVDPTVLRALWSGGVVPVVSPVANGAGGEPLNVNADEAALALATALGARALVYLSDVDGVRDAQGATLRLTAREIETLIEQGVVGGGMQMKVRAALEAAQAGIPEVVIAGPARLLGRFPGTTIVAEPVEVVS
jgi:acetylglutamate kinase